MPDDHTTAPAERLRYAPKPDAIIEPGLDTRLLTASRVRLQGNGDARPPIIRPGGLVMLRHPSRTGDRYTTPEVLL